MTDSSATGLTLKGNEVVPDQTLTDAEINHLRRLLAWLDCEYTLCADRQRGVVNALNWVAADGRPKEAQEVLDQQLATTRHVPAYVRQAYRMLQKAVTDHEQKAGVVE